jgi:hypothetical protein
MVGKYVTHKKKRFSKRRFLLKTNTKRMRSKLSNSRKHRKSRTHRKYRTHRKSRNIKSIFYGGQSQPEYPAVYGIENKAVLYPVSKYGVPAGFIDPPIPSNGPYGTGPIGRDIVSGMSMSGDNSYTYSGGAKHRKRRTRKYRGGGSPQTLMPQPLVDFGRSLTSGATKIINGFGGHTNSDSLNYKPYEQPIDKDMTYLRTNFPNVERSYQNADKLVTTTF